MLLVLSFLEFCVVLVYHKAQISEKLLKMSQSIETDLYINPSYITAMYYKSKKERSPLQKSVLNQNFKTNNYKGTVSKYTAKKIRLAIQWLIFMADQKKVYDKNTGKHYNYRAGVATIALPTGCTNIEERFFRDTLLTSILDAMRYKYDLKNYVWKIEKQKNGTLHAHITLDRYIPHKWLLSKWCSILDKHGLIEEYRSKFSSMDLQTYARHRRSTDSPNYYMKFKSHNDWMKAIVKAYQKGEETNWSLPNCTDIHSVKDVKRLAGYMVKYMSKDPNLSEKFKGRFWACSHSLSKLRTINVKVPESEMTAFNNYLEPATTADEELMYFREVDHEPIFYGIIYFLKKSRSALMKHPFFSQLYGLLKSLYDQSKLHELPYLLLIRDPVKCFTLKTLHSYAN
jgi:hypothetical protein